MEVREVLASKASSVPLGRRRLCRSSTPPVLTLRSHGILQGRALETEWMLVNPVILWLF